jgi:NAD(P) transhydrogenase
MLSVMPQDKFDLVVIGSGPAGEKGAAQAAYFGKKVALIEREPVFGGTAANTGTLPSKTLRETALFLSGFRNRELAGLHFTLKEKVTVKDFLTRERLVKENERARIIENLRRHHVTVYMGKGSLVDAHTVSVRAERCPEFTIHGDHILIATGSYPFRPPDYPFYDPRVYDSDTVLNLHGIPSSMLVIGGGVIGCEYACLFAALGVEVHLVEKRGEILTFLDREIIAALQARMEELGVHFYLNDVVESVKAGDTLEMQLRSGPLMKVETLLVSSGRCGNTEGLGLEKVGIAANEQGKIKVNEQYQTTVPNVYAAGDVIGNPALASTSMEQARVAVTHAFKFQYKEAIAPILPYGIYTIPECSMAGESEESLTAKKIPYVAGRAAYSGNARGQIVGDTQGFLKLLFREEDMRLLGIHMIGEQATELIHIGLTALLANAGAELFIQSCYNYPTLAEMYKYASYDAMGRRAARRKESS